MKKYAKIIDEQTKEVQVGVGCPDEYYKEIGMTLMDVEYAYDGNWYVEGFAPIKPNPTEYEIRQMREHDYQSEVDPITSHISRLRDTTPMTPEVEAEIADLIVERDAKFQEIKERYPYNEETENEVS